MLQSRVEKLETESIDLEHDLELARIRIQEHHRVFRKILGPGSEMYFDEQNDSDTGLNRSDANSGSRDNDSTVSE